MPSFGTVRVAVCCLAAILLATPALCLAQTSENAGAENTRVTLELASRAAHEHLVCYNQSDTYIWGQVRLMSDPADGSILYYWFELKPSGYIIVSASSVLPPVIAYSFTDTNESDGDATNPLADLLLSDLRSRLDHLDAAPAAVMAQRRAAWARLAAEDSDNTPGVETDGPDKGPDRFEQWPPPGSTTTGGWVETRWNQNSPYNQACPIDPVTGTRSYAGCPAVAMAQILHYHQRLNATTFSDADDYHHVYSGRNFWIDDDYAAHSFLSFPAINTQFDTIFGKYFHGTDLNNANRAALIFACGVAARQVYASTGSGTFGVSQAMDAYMKFGCDTAELLYQESPGPYERLMQNMIDGYPAHLAIVNTTWTSGHNLVVDGYNTDGYYHLNFGWGGSYDGWYLLPSELPYSLTVVEGIIVDILIDPCRSMDCNGDGFVDATDFAYLQECLSGPAIGWESPGCTAFDADSDEDSDLADYAAFQRAFGDSGT